MSNVLVTLLFFISIIPINSVAQTYGSSSDDYIWQERFNKSLTAAGKGNINAQYKVGEMFEKGMGTPINIEQALIWYKRASSNNHMKAHYRLGYLYYHGLGLSVNKTKAYSLFMKPAEQGHVRAQYYLGRLYAEGEGGVEKDPITALKWYRRSSLGGFSLAKRTLDEHYSPSGKILYGQWTKRQRPAEFLPSNITECEKQSSSVVECLSGELKRNIGFANITFITKATLYDIKKSGEFKITYRNKILEIALIEAEPEIESGIDAEEEEEEDLENNEVDKSTTKHFIVQKGWQATEHKLECKVDDQDTINCVINKVRKMKFNKFVLSDST